jgi:hypothetical protein
MTNITQNSITKSQNDKPTLDVINISSGQIAIASGNALTHLIGNFIQ